MKLSAADLTYKIFLTADLLGKNSTFKHSEFQNFNSFFSFSQLILFTDISIIKKALYQVFLTLLYIY